MASERTEAYKIYEVLRNNMYERVNGVRIRKDNSKERLEVLIEDTMERLYILHRKEVEEQFERTGKPRGVASILQK